MKLYELNDMVTRMITAENPNGEKGGACRAETGATAYFSRNLGKGWKMSPCIDIEPGATAVLMDVRCEGVIQSMWMGGTLSRELILRVYWEDEEVPAVACPLPDFFGNGFLNNFDRPFKAPFYPLNSLMVCVNPNNALNCYWEMPFRKAAKITLENIGERKVNFFYQINFCEKKVHENAGYFFARFRRTNPVPFKENFVVLPRTEGNGQYVGTALSVGLNGSGGWWGEGEMKFFLDGDAEYPSLCTTGTEDYFCGGYDWDVGGKYTPYSTPYAGMFYLNAPDGLYNSQQRFAMYRWHVVDPIRFRKDVRVELQDLGWYPNAEYKPRRDDFSAVAYFYLDRPSCPLDPLPDRAGLEI